MRYGIALLVAVLVLLVVVVATSIGALGVAAIGWLLHRWFDLTQWQGTLVSLSVAVGLGYLVFKMAIQPTMPWDLDSLGEYDDYEEEEEEEEEEPPIVPWRRSRPTPSTPPGSKPTSGPGRRK
jgi:hypothetical protein